MNRWERIGVGLLLIAALGFGGVVEVRSAFLKRRMGDLGVYLRGAWAVRQGGGSLYTVTCNNGWHYHYPPLFAILMTPLADPPSGEPPYLAVPYALSVGLWYLFSLACLAWGLHTLADALDPDSPKWSRRWWSLRLLPLLACLVPVAGTLVRGQVTLLLLALLCSWLAETVRGRPWLAGLWLSFAICLKIIPALLVLVPLLRRDRRCLAGCAVGLFIGMLVVPVTVLGPTQTMLCYRELVETVLAPGLGAGDDRSRAAELIDVTATDSQAFLAILHNARHPDPLTRPHTADWLTRVAHWLLAGAMTLVTLAAFRRREDAREDVLLGGTLILAMLLASPVCHLHYFCLAVPLLMVLVALGRGQGLSPGRGLLLLLAVYAVALLLPSLPGMQVTRDQGSALAGALLVWVAALQAGRPFSGALSFAPRRIAH